MFCVFTGGSFFTVRTTIVSRLSLSLSLALSVHLLSVGESVVYDSLSYSTYLPISTMG